METLIGTTFLTGLSLLFVTFMNSQNESVLGLRTVSTRDNLRNLVAKYVNSPKVMGKSALYAGPNNLGNIALDYCLNGTILTSPSPTCASPPNCCVDNTATPQPFNLIDPGSSGGTILFAGTDALVNPPFSTIFNPVRYDATGKRCTTASPSCPLEVVTSFMATCAVGTTCAIADTIRVHYEVRHGKDPATGLPIKLKAGPPLQLAFDDILFGSTTAAAAPGPANSWTNMQVFDYTGGSVNLTVPVGVTKILVESWGGGGGGGSGACRWSPNPFFDGTNGANGAASTVTRGMTSLASVSGANGGVAGTNALGTGGAGGNPASSADFVFIVGQVGFSSGPVVGGSVRGGSGGSAPDGGWGTLVGTGGLVFESSPYPAASGRVPGGGGAGGAGQFNIGSCGGGGGGGGGAYGKGIVAVSPGDVLSISVGSGGAAAPGASCGGSVPDLLKGGSGAPGRVILWW